MIERQLICRGIHNPAILNAFQDLDRDDFVEVRFKKYVNYDINIPLTENKKYFIKPYLMAKVIQNILTVNHDSIAIIGDISGFTTAIIKKIFINSNCITKELHEFLEEKNNFRVIFLDSAAYSKNILEHVKELSPNGIIIYLEQINQNDNFSFTINRNIQFKLNYIVSNPSLATLFS